MLADPSNSTGQLRAECGTDREHYVRANKTMRPLNVEHSSVERVLLYSAGVLEEKIPSLSLREIITV